MFFFFNDTATTEIYTLSLHDALPISICERKYWPARIRLTLQKWRQSLLSMSHVECRRAVLAKSHRRAGGAGVCSRQHARGGSCGKIRLRSRIPQGPERALSNDHRANDHAEGAVHEAVGRGLPEVFANRRRVENSGAGFAPAK